MVRVCSHICTKNKQKEQLQNVLLTGYEYFTYKYQDIYWDIFASLFSLYATD